MQSKEEAKTQVSKLVEKFKELEETGEIKTFNEEQTKKSFIDPFFEALGWNTSDHREVCLEETIGAKRADYSFRLDGVPRFYLEAKSPKADTNREDFMSQVVNYAWLKNRNWAVLTNFQEIKLFNALGKGKHPKEKILFDIHYSQYATRFEDLWLLSKESFLENKLDAFAERVHKKIERDPVTKQIFKDFINWRLELSKNISKNSKKEELSEELIDEAVQRILDRLIFIRVCEDRKIEPESLMADFRLWQANKKGRTLTEVLSKKFMEFNKIYNSELFAEHFSENLKIDEEVLEKIINDLYENLNEGYFYDFSAIDADILGSIYEQYLGHLLKKTPKSAKLSDKKQHRKEMGIYYTPTYIVEYIVKNTLGEKLKEYKTIEEIEKIKVLDPACGSGSFLIKVFDEILNKCKENIPKEQHDKLWAIKNQILLQNIYGVDLDEKAVEISQLNLLLKALEKRQLLPELSNSIKNGNSLIDDEKLAGSKAFKWEKEFKQIIENGGFDVIIGNPPYVSGWNMDLKFRDWVKNSARYQSAVKHWDMYVLFLEKGISLLKNGGKLGMIIPSSFLNQAYAEKIRNIILSNCNIVKIIDLSDINVFADATIRNCIIIIEKRKTEKNLVTITKTLTNQIDNGTTWSILQKTFETTPEQMFRIDLQEKDLDLIKKIQAKSIELGEIVYSTTGVVPHSEKENKSKEEYLSTQKKNKKSVPYIEGKNIGRYFIDYDGRFLEYDQKVIYRPSLPELLCQKKIIIKNIIGKSGIAATFDDFGYFTNETINCVTTKNNLANVLREDIHFSAKEIINSKKYNLKFILGIINSKLSNWAYKKLKSGDLHFYPKDVRTLLVYNIENNSEKKEINEIINEVNKLIKLNNKLTKLGHKLTSERQKLEEEIERTDAEIDDLVYKIYGITDSEKKIIEESLK